MNLQHITKDTFLNEMSRMSKEVSLFKVAKSIGRHYNTVRNYVGGQGDDVEIMKAILSESKDQLKRKINLLH